MKYDDSNLIKCLSCEVKISQKKRYCKPCLRNLERESPQSSYPDFYGGIYRKNSGSAGKYKNHYKSRKYKNHYKNVKPSIAKVEQKKNKPVVTRDLFGREHTYPVEQKYNICKKCKARFKPRKVGLISRIGISVLGVFAIGPLGIFAGGVAKGLEADRDLCDECNYSAPE